jgi:hypothetical protein
MQTAGTSISNNIINVNQGNYYVDTKRVFKRPADVSVQIRQNGGSSECGVISVFPQTSTRHSGYNAGIGWWAKYFGAGVDGSISRYGDNNGKTSSWHTVRINVASDGKVYYFLDGKLRYKVANNKYQSGVIRLGNNCRNFQYRNLVVKQAKPPMPLVQVKATPSEWNFRTKGVSISKGVERANQGNYYMETRRTFKRPVDMSVKVRQTAGGSECGVIALFPQTATRHSGYNAGIGWWAKYFGAGVDGSISKRGNNNGQTSSWHTVRINAAADGKVYFYLDGQLRYTVANNKYQSGVIRLGNNCRNFEYKDLAVNVQQVPTLPAPTKAPIKPTLHGVRGLGLQSGWAPYGHGYEAPSTTKYGDVCVVSGLIKRSGMRNPLATLPADCRPNKRVIFSLNNHQYQLRVDVLTNGQIHYVAGTWRHGWLNLDGINFATRHHENLALQNGWAAYGGSYKVPTYTKTGVVCEVEGLVKGSRWGSSMVQLPSDCRPRKRLIFNVNNHAKSCRVDVHTNGQVTWHAGGKDHGWVSLGGIMFSTENGAGVSLANGWGAYGHGYGSPTVVKSGTLCLVSGLLRGSKWGHVMATLPSGCRPKGRLIFNMNNHAKHARVDVLTNGQIVWVTGGRDHSWISITGINIHVGTTSPFLASTRSPTRVPVRRITTSYTPSYGGNGGGAVNSYCPGNHYINYWSIRTGSLVDRIQGRCNNGSWLSKCGGNGGGAHAGPPRWGTQKMYVRTGALVDQFNGRGGNGGGGHWLNCGSGRKVTGYQMRCGSLVDKVRFQCKNV